MYITALELENDLRKNLAAMNQESLQEERDELVARLRVMGMYGLAAELVSGSSAETLSRLYKVFGVELLSGIDIVDLMPDVIEFESLYGLNDPFTNEPGRQISFTVKDTRGRFPVYLKPENIRAHFSIITEEDSLSWRVVSCVQNTRNLSTDVVLEVRISDGAFFSGGEFIMRTEVYIGTALAAGRMVRFKVKNTFPTFFKDDISGKSVPVKPLPQMRRAGQIQTPQKKEIITYKNAVQTRQKNTRISFDAKHRGAGTPVVLCGNAAFKAGIASKTSVNISFRLPIYKNLERKLMSSGLTARILPETPVWVEWDDIITIYNIQYKGFLLESGGRE